MRALPAPGIYGLRDVPLCDSCVFPREKRKRRRLQKRAAKHVVGSDHHDNGTYVSTESGQVTNPCCSHLFT